MHVRNTEGTDNSNTPKGTKKADRRNANLQSDAHTIFENKNLPLKI